MDVFNKKTDLMVGFLLGRQRCEWFAPLGSLGRLNANAFELTCGNALFPLGRAGDMGAGAT